MKLLIHWQALALFMHLTTSFAQLGKTKTPEGCRKLNTDADWPPQKIWEDAMPGIEYLRSTFSRATTPDYRYQVRSVPDVQRALKFAQENNVRVSIITTGHDYLGRSTASSGLLIDLSLLRGIRISESYTPTLEGVPDVAWDQKPNVITPKEGVQAAATFGPGVLGQPLNSALNPSKLFAVTGAEGMIVVRQCTEKHPLIKL
jgi:FAD/FMN-containing dehydrogenase